MALEVTPAESVWAAVVNASWPAPAATTVSPCVADVSGLSEAVSVGVPESVSLYLKLALLDPTAMLTLVIVVVPAGLSLKTPPAEVLLRLTLLADPLCVITVSSKCRS